MSSRLGFVAEVIATESPSQQSPVVIQMTCAVTGSVACWRGTNSISAPSRLLLFQQIRGSGSPTSWSITRLPPKLVSTRTMPGGSVFTSPIVGASGARARQAPRRRPRAPRSPRSGPRWRRTSGRCRAARDAPATAGATGTSASRTSIATPEARASSLSTDATPPRVASRMQRRCGAGGVEQRVDRRPQARVSDSIVGVELELAAGEHDRGAVLADRARTAGSRSPGRSDSGDSARARVAPPDARSS